MSTAADSPHRYTFEEYLAFERESEIKHEFYDGEIFAMAGGTLRHNALALNIGAALRGTRSPGCVGFQSDQRVRVLATGRTTYPDVTMVCGPIELDPGDVSKTTITNPTLIIEVLSPTTEQADRGEKWRHYQLIPSLQEYVLVSQIEPRIEVFRRQDLGSWEYRDVREGSVALASGPSLNLASIYEDLPAA